MPEGTDPLSVAERLRKELGAKMRAELSAVSKGGAPEGRNKGVQDTTPKDVAVGGDKVDKKEDAAGEVAEESPIKPTGEAEKEPKEERKKVKEDFMEMELAKTREEYILADQMRMKAEKEEKKLAGTRSKIKDIYYRYRHFAGNRKEEYTKFREGKISGARVEAEEARRKFSESQKKLKFLIKTYRDNELIKKRAELEAVGKSEAEIKDQMEKIAKEIVLATTVREAAKIDSLKTQKQIEQMGDTRRYINEKVEVWADWYKKQPLKTKIALATGLGGLGVAGAIMGFTPIVSFVLAGQAGLRALGGAMTTGGLSKVMESSREKLAEKRLSKELAGKYLETLKNQNDELDDKIFERLGSRKNEKAGRFILAGTAGALVGSGALAQAVKNGLDTEFGKGMTGKLRDLAGKPADLWKHLFGGEAIDDSATDVLLEPTSGGGTGLPEPVVITPDNLAVPGGAEAHVGILNLKIGGRGPEGAIIDHFRGNPDSARAFGWDSQTDINKWAGTRAHQLWLESVQDELVKPGMAEKLTAQGFTPDADGYAKAMHKIGQGFVELDPQGHMHLTDDTSFLKVGASGPQNLSDALEKLPEPTTGEIDLTAGSVQDAESSFQSAKNAVSSSFKPDVFFDKTFVAAKDVTLGKILEQVPEEAYKGGRHALSNYWHDWDINNPKFTDTLNLPGSSRIGMTYGDFKKYTEIARFLRETPAMQNVQNLNNMTVDTFFKAFVNRPQ